MGELRTADLPRLTSVASTTPRSPKVEERIRAVAEILTERQSKEDSVSVQPAMPRLATKELFMGPFLFESVLEERRKYLKETISEQYGIDLVLFTANPPYHAADDIETKGYWLKPRGWTDEQRVQDLRSQVSAELMSMMLQVDKHRPRILIGEGQGGVVIAMSGFPVILESACRDREVSPQTMERFRQAWSGIDSLMAINLSLSPVSNNTRHVPFRQLSDAFPNMGWN